MAAGILPKPGTKLGPCTGTCKHKDCKESREMAASVCGICDEPIGFDHRFYSRESGGYVHADCYEGWAEAHA